MSERVNGGPFTLGFGQQAFIEYWWGNGDDRHLAIGCAHPTSHSAGSNFVSFDQRVFVEALGGAQIGHIGFRYGFTIRNDAHEGDNPTPFDVYVATP